MINAYAIILIKTVSEYRGLKGNQGSVVANGSLRGRWILNRV